MIPTLGVCYYPEHWPEAQWAEDAARMVETGLTWVRIGEFAWSLMEPEPGRFDWGWLDRAIETLGGAGLRIVLGTPTATPPRWMLDRHPDMLAHDAEGRPRKFGSRRHYCFSHDGYREECRRITRAMAERYGSNPHIQAWQTDNEYACHNTTLSYSPAARAAFRDWLAQRYQSTDALNRAWGNVFWSMAYDSFDQIDLPNLTVTEPNHPHTLDFKRFSSDQVVRFNRVQCEEIRRHTDAPIIHNFMGRETSFDHFEVSRDLDIASWDSYPIGFLSDRIEETPDFKARFLRQGHPDNQAFHHDIYRACGAMRTGDAPAHGRWWVMEQQPGPVNWAPWNPAPLPGMCRLWAWEAIAHGAECVSYFRWRQAPFAQEQMHAGLLRPDSQPAPALAEAAQVAREIAGMGAVEQAPAPVGLVVDYDSFWAWEAQPQGADFHGFDLAFDAYRALRRAGLSIDILHPATSDLSAYKLVLAPGLLHLSVALRGALERYDGIALIGPRSDTKTPQLSIPNPMGPNIAGLDVTVAMTESLPPIADVPLDAGRFIRWFEHLEGSAPILRSTAKGQPAVMGTAHLRYLAGWPDHETFAALVRDLCAEAGIKAHDLPEGLRLRDAAGRRFVLNYGTTEQIWEGRTIPPAGVIWT